MKAPMDIEEEKDVVQWQCCRRGLQMRGEGAERVRRRNGDVAVREWWSKVREC